MRKFSFFLFYTLGLKPHHPIVNFFKCDHLRLIHKQFPNAIWDAMDMEIELNIYLGWDFNSGTQDCESRVLPVCHCHGNFLE